TDRLTPLQRRAFEWDQKKRPADLLLRWNELNREEFRAREDRLTPVEGDFLRASRAAREREDQIRTIRRSDLADQPAESGCGRALPTYPEPELFFPRRGQVEFGITLQLREPGNDLNRRFEADSIRIDLARFATPELLADPPRYGWELGVVLFERLAVR